jgi:hypothetical protein
MTNILQDGAAWLGSQLKAHAGVSVTYTRGTDSASITATATMQQYDVVDAEGFSTSVVSRDYLVHAADLVLAGSLIVPRAGDQIAETIAGVACTFEVMPLGEKREFDPLDSDGLLLLIHTKKVA